MATWQDRLNDARGFREVAESASDSGHRNQAASNAILAAIAANDALCLRRIGRRSQGESHMEAVRVLQEACRGSVWEEQAAQTAQQLRDIIRLKSAAQYGGRPLSAATVAKLLRQVERLIEWVEEVLES